MIFLFDKFKKLKGTVRNRHTISLLYERERNGLYTVSAEIPLKITDKKTVYNYHKKVKDSDFLGHYDREGRFQLHKIAAVDIEDSSIFIKGVHLFFDEAKAGAIIQERRFRQSEVIDGARAAFDSIGWSVVDFDVSDTKDYIFYNVSPLEARAILVETFGFEFDYWLDFDGKNIRNKQISVKREMGKDSNKRYNYGHNVLNIKVEQDYSEIYTAVIGRGKGEDLGDDAYGRRIEYTDVEWKTPSNPMNKPKGTRVLHDENATQLFGYHEDGKVSPRTKVEVFEDIEDPSELLQASYEWLKENSVPKAVFSLEVPDGDGLDLGDKVHVIYRDIDLVKHTRVTKVVDDLVSGNRDVEFGDTAYFKTDRRLSGVKSELKRVGGSMSSRISRLKTEFDRRFDNEVQQWKDDFEQSLIDSQAQIEVVREDMSNLIEGTRAEMTDDFNQSVSETKEYAEQQAQAKAESVQSDLDSFKNSHQQLYDEVTGDLSQTRTDLLERINNIDTQSFNLIRGSRFDEPDMYTTVGGTVHDDEDMPYFRYGISSGNIQYIATVDDIQFEAGKTYTLSLDYRTSNGVSIDYLRIIPTDGSADINIRNNITESDMAGIIPDGEWHRTFLTFTVPRNLTGDLRIGSDFTSGTKGQIDIRLPYLTTSGNTQWVFHPSDGYESIISVMDRIDEFEQSVRAELESVYGNLSSTRTELQNQLDAARAELDGLEVGGRNYIKDSKVIHMTSDSGGRDNTDISYTDDYIEIKSNKDFQSYWYRYYSLTTDNRITDESIFVYDSDYHTFGIDVLTESDNFEMYINQREAGHSNSYSSDTISLPNTNGRWQRIYITLPLKKDGLQRSIFYVFLSGGRASNPNAFLTGDYIRLKNSKLEKGNRGTDWTPAPEDTEQKITNINQTVTNIEGELSTKVEQTEVDALRGTVTNQGTLLSQTAEELSSKAEKSVVDTLSGRVSNAESSVTQNSEEIAKRLYKSVYDEDKKDTDAKITQWTNTATETAEGLERVIGRVSETESGIESAQTRIEAEAGRIDGVLSRTSKVEGQVQDARLAIEANADGLALRATKSEVELAIDGIEVGGRNLILNSAWNLTTSEYLMREFNTSEELIIGEVYTITIHGRLGEGRPYFRFYTNSGYSHFLDPDGTSGGGIFEEVSEGVYRATLRYSRHLSRPHSNRIFRIYNMTADDSSESYISTIQLERGNKSTEWTPAPEDIDASLTEVTDRVTTAEAELVVQAGEISQRASKSELDRVTGRVSTAETSIKQNSDSLKLTATKTEVENAIDGIEVGGRNLITGEKSKEVVSKLGSGNITIYTDVKEFTTYTISFNYKVTKGDTPTSFLVYPYGNGSNGWFLAPAGQLEGYTKITFTPQANQYPSLLLYSGTGNADGTTREVVFTNIKLEHGNKATDWTPAPEDAEAKITKAQADITANAKEIALKASQTELNSVTGRVSSAESQLSVQSEQISLRATKTEVGSAIDGIEVGGRNLLENSDFVFGLSGWRAQYHSTIEKQSNGSYLIGNTVATFNGIRSPRTINVTKGETYTVTIEGARSSNMSKLDYLYIMYDLPGVTNQPLDIPSFEAQAGKFSRISCTFVAKESAENIDLLIANRPINALPETYRTGFYLKNVKIEKGNKATDWSPAPEDIDSSISEVADRVTSAETSIKANADSIKLTATKTEVERAVDGIEVGGRNLLLDSTKIVSGYADSFEANGREYRPYGYAWGFLFNVDLVKGQTYTISVPVINQSETEDSVSRIIAGSLISFRQTLSPLESKVLSHTFTANQDEEQANIRFLTDSYEYPILSWSYPKLEKGVKATDWTPAPEDADARINDITKDYVKQSSVKVTPDSVTIGSTVVNGTTIGSVLSVSPTGIDVVADAMRLSGDLLVRGDVTALAVDAIEGNFSRLFASSLTTNVIKSSHIQTDTALARKIFSTNANIDELITRTHFSNNIKTMSIDAVHADLRSVNSEIMTSNIIKSNWLDVDTALFNRFTANEAFIDSLEVKAANIRDLTGYHIKGGMIESLNDSTIFNLMDGHLTFYHDDNSYTRIGKNGLRRHTSSDSKTYHYLIHVTSFTVSNSGGSPRWIQLPDDFKGKGFNAYVSIADSLSAIDYNRSIQRIVATGSPGYSIDYTNARVPITAYKSETLGDGYAPSLTSVQGMLIAIY